ncbi:hypothetical protein L1987_47196 [Smallanthus sonchifolius]|uniref:Uncharacterized protein n=1 Tax=Smallanthus sonchifolius TaxID=185202 RepID=A0ACB9G2E3_9ASTR|nr:hypothetical protein L1987_47196 [Smallanthus sonchifolius]
MGVGRVAEVESELAQSDRVILSKRVAFLGRDMGRVKKRGCGGVHSEERCLASLPHRYPYAALHSYNYKRFNFSQMSYLGGCSHFQ